MAQPLTDPLVWTVGGCSQRRELPADEGPGRRQPHRIAGWSYRRWGPELSRVRFRL